MISPISAESKTPWEQRVAETSKESRLTAKANEQAINDAVENANKTSFEEFRDEKTIRELKQPQGMPVNSFEEGTGQCANIGSPNPSDGAISEPEDWDDHNTQFRSIQDSTEIRKRALKVAQSLIAAGDPMEVMTHRKTQYFQSKNPQASPIRDGNSEHFDLHGKDIPRFEESERPGPRAVNPTRSNGHMEHSMLSQKADIGNLYKQPPSDKTLWQSAESQQATGHLTVTDPVASSLSDSTSSSIHAQATRGLFPTANILSPTSTPVLAIAAQQAIVGHVSGSVSDHADQTGPNTLALNQAQFHLLASNGHAGALHQNTCIRPGGPSFIPKLTPHDHAIAGHVQSPMGPHLWPKVPPPCAATTPVQQQSPSWAAILQPKAAANIKLKYTKHARTGDRLKLSMPDELLIEGSKAWDTTLVGYFIGKRLPFSLVKSVSNRLWNKVGLSDMYATESGYFFFKFNSMAECEAVLEGGPWHVAGQPIILKKWHVGLELTKEAQATIPIWVNIYNIPLEYWNPEGLGFIASAIGKPLQVHQMTASCRRLSFARLCIEVSAEFELLKDFDIEYRDPVTGDLTMITLKIEYQWNPIRCAKCRKFGHNCVVTSNKPIPQKPVSRPQSSQSKRKQEEGTWMVVSKGKNVVEQDPICETSTSTNQECARNNNIITMDNQLIIGSDQEDSRDIHPTITRIQSNQQADTASPTPESISSESVDKQLCALDTGNDSIVNTITGAQHYAATIHGNRAQEKNKFAMLGIDSEDTIEEGEVTDLNIPAPHTQAMQSVVIPPAISKQPSGKSQKLKNKQHSSSGKKTHSHRRV